MSLRLIATTLSALLLGLYAAAQAQSSTPTPAESDNPINDRGGNYNHRSNITGIAPSVPSLSLEVLEFAALTNHTGQTVTVYGYQGEPYARVMAGGTVQVNTHSPAYYLNQNFYSDVSVPSSASPTATHADRTVSTVADRGSPNEPDRPMREAW